MANFFIVLIIIVSVLFALRPTFKHFKGQGGCCGGGDYKPKKKKLSRIIQKKTFYIEGMSCKNCSNRVTEALNDIEGLSAKVSHKKGTAVISFEKLVEDEEIFSAVEKAGYSVKK